jgi:hypothetical protein
MYGDSGQRDPKYNNNMSTAAVFLDIEKAFDTTWYPGLLYKVSKLQFSTSLIKLISSFLPQRKFRISVEGEMSTPRYMQAGVQQGSVLSSTLYNLYRVRQKDLPHFKRQLQTNKERYGKNTLICEQQI